MKEATPRESKMRPMSLPFRPDRSLHAELVDHYLCPALDWLTDAQDEKTAVALPVRLGSIWETAHVVMLLLYAKPLLEGCGAFKEIYTDRIDSCIEFLRNRARRDAFSVNWDRGLYDTAVVIRALLAYAQTMEDELGRDELLELASRGMIWLCQEVEGWEDERYTLSIGDLAEALRTVLLWQQILHMPFNTYLHKQGIDNVHPVLDDFIVDYLLRIVGPTVGGSLQAESDSVEKEPVGRDVGVHGIAEAIFSFVDYYNDRQNSGTGEQERMTRIIQTIQQSVRFLEKEHVDGSWGLPDMTAYALTAYLQGHSIWERIKPEAHIVFKSIRWLCDDKQFFRDGSVLHSLNHTIYFAMALLQVCNQWLSSETLSIMPVIDLYDLMVWQMPARTSAERAQRLEIQGQLEQVEFRVRNLENRLNVTSSQLRKWRLAFFVLSWSLGGLLISLVFGFLKIQQVQISALAVPSLNANWEVLVAFVTGWVAAGYYLSRRIDRLHRRSTRPKDTGRLAISAP